MLKKKGDAKKKVRKVMQLKKGARAMYTFFHSFFPSFFIFF
jgi:hypothetical protein